jgi:hypothetical protein
MSTFTICFTMVCCTIAVIVTMLYTSGHNKAAQGLMKGIGVCFTKSKEIICQTPSFIMHIVSFFKKKKD